jgi:ribose-phosphate pyrophosphokinase
VHGFFSVPVDHLHALRELASHFRGDGDRPKGADLSRTVVVSPDLGNAKSAAAFARMLGVPVAAGAKQRFSDDEVRISAVIGDVENRDIIVLDDEIANGSTVLELLARLRERGARSSAWPALTACSAAMRWSDSPRNPTSRRSSARTRCRYRRVRECRSCM